VQYVLEKKRDTGPVAWSLITLERRLNVLSVEI
jgi:hypothetical protein